MGLQNIKNREGFTLVELLIVIVVIAILAAITIVAYNGVQNKAHTTASNSAASEVIKKAALYNTENSAYPASIATLNALAQTDPANLSTTDVTAGSGTPAKPSADNTVWYSTCGSPVTGAQAVYWDFSAGAVATALKTGTGC